MSAQTSSVIDSGVPVDSGSVDSGSVDSGSVGEGTSSGASVRSLFGSRSGSRRAERDGDEATSNRGRGLLGGGARSFWILIAAVLTVGLVGVLLLSTTVNSDAFRLHELEKQANRLAEQQQAIEKRLAAMQSPDSLERKAIELGMVPNEVPVFLRLADGKVLGVPTPAKPRPVPAPSSAPGASGQAAGQAAVQPQPAADAQTGTGQSGTSPAGTGQAGTAQTGSAQQGVNP